MLNISETVDLIDSNDQALSDAAYLICGIYLIVLGLVAFVGNIIVLLVLSLGKPNFMKIHTVMLFTISTSDLVIACTAYPLTAVSSFHRRWVFNDTVCVVNGFIVYFFVMCNINSLCVMAICRYVIVCQPHLEPYIRGRYIKYILMAVWLYALFWTGAPLIGWSSYAPESFGTSCTLDWDGRTPSDLSYNFLCILFCYLLPLGIFLFCYYNVAKSSLFMAEPTSVGTLPLPADRSPSELAMEEINRKIKLRASRHMTMICFIMIASFVVSWSPYAVLTFFNIISAPASPEVQVLPTMFAKVSCAVNPIIYCGICDRFRDAAVRLVTLPNRIQPLSSVRRVGPRSQLNVAEDVTVLGLADIRTTPSHLDFSLRDYDEPESSEPRDRRDTSDSCRTDNLGSTAFSRSTSSFA